ncbi:MAG: ATP-binding protein [Desulfomonilaceae bacterium]
MASSQYRTIRIKIVALTLFTSLIPLFTLGIVTYYQFDAAYSGKVREALKTRALTLQRSIELFFGERAAQLVTIAKTQPLDRLKDGAYLGRVLDTMQSRSRSILDLEVVDDEGNHVAYAGPYYNKLKPVNYRNETWFKATLSHGVYISDVFPGFGKVPHLIIAVSGMDGSTRWILRAAVNSAIVDDIMRRGQMGKKGDSFIVNRANVLQSAPRFSGKLFNHPTAPDFSSTTGPTVQEIAANGDRSYFAVCPINKTRWVVVLKEDPHGGPAALFKDQYAGILILVGGIFAIVVGTVLAARSITNELIRVEHETAERKDLAVQSAKMASLGKMAAGIAHEINNPLAIIGEKAGWMKDLIEKENIGSSPNFAEFEDCLKKIERQIDRSRTITHRLLRFGRRMEPTEEMVDVNHVLAETVAFLEKAARHRNITIHTSYEENLPSVMTDPSQLQQVLLNIINNGIDAVGTDGHINLRTSHDGRDYGNVVIEVSDDGPGIPKEILGKIFEPFFTTKDARDGTGLGLSISYSIIEELGGKITVASEEGKGTTFTICLPERSGPR